MNHKKNKLIQLNTGQFQTRSNVMRSMLTNLVRSGQMITTPKRAKVLKAYADSFFSRLVNTYTRYENSSDGLREAIRLVKQTIFTEAEWKKIIADLLPKFQSENKDSSFVANYKLWYRKWDGVESILVKII